MHLRNRLEKFIELFIQHPNNLSSSDCQSTFYRQIIFFFLTVNHGFDNVFFCKTIASNSPETLWDHWKKINRCAWSFRTGESFRSGVQKDLTKKKWTSVHKYADAAHLDILSLSHSFQWQIFSGDFLLYARRNRFVVSWKLFCRLKFKQLF